MFYKRELGVAAIDCEFKSIDQVATLHQGDKYTFSGLIKDVQGKTVYLTQCSTSPDNPPYGDQTENTCAFCEGRAL